MKFFLLSLGLIILVSCATNPKQSEETVKFQLSVNENLLRNGKALIQISVPTRITEFKAPKSYGGAPMFLEFVEGISAVDEEGNNLELEIVENIIKLKKPSLRPYTLQYRYNVPQKLNGESNQSLPVLNKKYGQFDHNMTFLVPVGAEKIRAELGVEGLKNWNTATGWGVGSQFSVPRVEQLTSGLTVMGSHKFETSRYKNIDVVYSILGNFSHELLKTQLNQVIAAQEQIIGSFPTDKFLVVLQPTNKGCCKGTALKNSLLINIPSDEKLKPFNFAAIGTMSHELFHTWNIHHVYPASEDGAYLLTEGFTNYFAVSALTRAGLISNEKFAWFLWNYRRYLESNPNYGKADFNRIQDGFKNNDNRLADLAYEKGPFVAVLMDIAFREDTNGKANVGTWFSLLVDRFGGKKGYTPEDLKQLVLETSGKQNGSAIKVFESAFMGKEKLNLEKLFSDLGFSCEPKTKDCWFTSNSKKSQMLRQGVFSATL